MKLRNKKTGMIGEVGYITTSDGSVIVNNINDQDEWYEYNSLAELNEAWEDYEEEPKIYWYIMSSGETHCIEDIDNDFDKGHKQIGNYFTTQEEAEKAVEKLKALKRLKDKITAIDRANICEVGTATLFIRYKNKDHEGVQDDIDLLFGGEE